MTPRQIRRAAERKARKLARKNPSPAQVEANRLNAQLSSGPRTEEGKAISSKNNFRHGFTAAFTVLPTEDAAAYQLLLDDLHNEHDPQTPTENLLVTGLAQHQWLTQRALRLQDELFATRDLNDPAVQKQLARFTSATRPPTRGPSTNA